MTKSFLAEFTIVECTFKAVLHSEYLAHAPTFEGLVVLQPSS